jgi:hypothetical protein
VKLSREEDVVKYLLKKISLDERTGCWVWLGAKNQDGYGRFWRQARRRTVVHRWMYEKYVGPVPNGMELHHTCGNRACINPEHLEPMVIADHKHFHR